VFLYNNTILTETNGGASANVHWRNNLMLGENAQAAIFSVNTNTNYSSSDYNDLLSHLAAGFVVGHKGRTPSSAPHGRRERS
jgi:hypothetical protein